MHVLLFIKGLTLNLRNVKLYNDDYWIILRHPKMLLIKDAKSTGFFAFDNQEINLLE